jgi:hypothetical protein
MTFFSFSLAFGSSSCASCVLDLKFKLCAFCVQCTHQGGDWETKWSVPCSDCDERLTCRGLNLNLGYFSFFTPICSCGESCLLVSWWCCVRSALCTRRLGARVSWLSLKTKVGGFPDLNLKTGSCSLVIWPTKSSWRFLYLRLKTKWEEICQFAPQNWWADEDAVRTHVNIR